MKLDINSQAITLTCPTCKKKFDEKIGRLKQNPTLTCRGCKALITIDANQLRRDIDAIEKRLNKALSGFGNLG